MLSPIFSRTSGFRGETNKEITPVHALAVGTLYAETCLESARRNGREFASLVVARDQRHGASMLHEIVMGGVQSVGAQAIDLGQTPTPVALTWLAHHAALDGAILVTGSHMDPERIGLILINPDGTYCHTDVTGPVQQSIPGFFETPRPLALYSQILPVERINPGVRDAFYLDQALKGINEDSVRTRAFKVLIDPGNATATDVAGSVLGQVGWNVTVINGEVLPIPNRKSEVREAYCQEAIQRTKEGGLDIGACFDGDADRVLFITRDGKALSEDVVAAIFARHVLEAGDVCVATLNSSGLMAHVCQMTGARLVYCEIGQPDTGRAVVQHRAKFASEPAAKYWFGNLWNWYDGPFAVAKMLEIMAGRQKTLAELADELPLYYQAADKIPVDDAKKADVCMRAMAEIKRQLGSEIDREEAVAPGGIKFMLKDGSWLMIRPSGTEPVCRISSDSSVKHMADSLTAMAKKIMGEVVTSQYKT